MNREDTTMVFYPNRGNDLYGENIMHYKLSNAVLSIAPPGIGFVEEKYFRVPSP